MRDTVYFTLPISASAATTISLVGNATIKGIYELSSSTSPNTLTFNIPSGKTLTLSGITITKNTADVIFAKTGNGTANAKVVRTAGATIDSNATINEGVDVK